jgi:hypothetical protein
MSQDGMLRRFHMALIFAIPGYGKKVQDRSSHMGCWHDGSVPLGFRCLIIDRVWSLLLSSDGICSCVKLLIVSYGHT